MKKLLVSIAVVLFLVFAADAAQPKISPDRINTSQPFPSITMDEDANITMDGGLLADAGGITFNDTPPTSTDSVLYANDGLLYYNGIVVGYPSQQLSKNHILKFWSDGPVSIPDSFTGWTSGGGTITYTQIAGDIGSYALRVTTPLSNTTRVFQESFDSTGILSTYNLAGKTITLTTRVKSGTANRVRAFIRDEIGDDTFSSYHSGGGEYEWLTVTRTIANNATYLQFGTEVTTGSSISYDVDVQQLFVGPAHPVDAIGQPLIVAPPAGLEDSSVIYSDSDHDVNSTISETLGGTEQNNVTVYIDTVPSTVMVYSGVIVFNSGTAMEWVAPQIYVDNVAQEDYMRAVTGVASGWTTTIPNVAFKRFTSVADIGVHTIAQKLCSSNDNIYFTRERSFLIAQVFRGGI